MKLHEALNIDLNQINREIENLVARDKDVPKKSQLAQSILELVGSGGKRLRPLMVIVGGRFGRKPDGRRTLQLAAAAEFIHAASLIHDDIIDDAELRRGGAALHVKTGVLSAVHIGNYMSARVIELLSKYTGDKDRYVHDLSSVATAQLCLGEYQQMEHAFDYDLTLEQYLEKSLNKTAMLMATCLRVGALSTESPDEVAQLLYRFGEALGMSFQIQDDLLDFTQSAEKLGKPAGSDLRHGQVTLPVLFALQDPALAPAIRRIGPDSSEEEVAYVLNLVTGSDALARTAEVSQSYLDQAAAIVQELSSYPAHADLQTLLQYFAGRDY
ncbi:heptaprenyl diphosphate synthase [Paenibacillus sp. FSL R7-0273]|uniref:polyprenyl synthetase family protein n=1 Tax=Paenibacillus sp. FSL R7-0273 TaxID=1536772 RepID=UPI0004F6EB12|nr:polyprenyl synthetase family protein [Paenibacillus sp. FSL R7-0273]AIQ44851.1 heptaprenyl diphosphate synthase [Paenibacillus sp. FSL R7-0273]OMF93294.1 heptaprenyl diphosphate synthase [Paenibacillus sp. FSL R7-0273]